MFLSKNWLKSLLPAFVQKKIFTNAIMSSSSKSSEFPKTLAEFGYGFNEDGQLRQLDPTTKEPGDKGFEFNVSDDQSHNQRHYEALGDVITEHVYELLVKNGMHKIQIPSSLAENKATFYFANKADLSDSKKLLILIHGSGVVRAGQWARSLIINQSLNHGTQLAYIKKGIELGYDILVTNTNDNYRQNKPIPGHGSPVEHADSLWQQVVLPAKPQSIAIVAHSYGGVVAMSLADKNAKYFQEKVFALGFTDSVHGRQRKNDDLQAHLQKIGRNWVTSSKPLDTSLGASTDAGTDIPRYSAGHKKHEWTSWACMDALFEYFEKNYENFDKIETQQESASKKPKVDL